MRKHNQKQNPSTQASNLIVDASNSEGFCPCVICTGNLNYEVIRRGDDEYILIDGRLLTLAAPAHCSEGAHYHLHENIILPWEEGRSVNYKEHLWPAMAGVFDPETTVDLYRALQRERQELNR